MNNKHDGHWHYSPHFFEHVQGHLYIDTPTDDEPCTITLNPAASADQEWLNEKGELIARAVNAALDPRSQRDDSRTLRPLVTITGGVGELVHGDAEIIDFDDWNADDATQGEKQEIIERIQSAGYRAVVSGTEQEPFEEIQIFAPDAPYDQYINNLPDTARFAVYDPEED